MSSSTQNSSSQISSPCSESIAAELVAAELAAKWLPVTMRQSTNSLAATTIQQPPTTYFLPPTAIKLSALIEQHKECNKMPPLATFANNTDVPSSILPSSSSPSSSISHIIQATPNGDIQKFLMNFAQQNGCQNDLQKHLNWEEEERKRQKQAMLFNKAISHEKRKFTQPISDFMVKEVLKRKSHLLEHNTSRDLKFSEEKRKAWETVRDLLKQKFVGFNMGIENIKSHWRYRKRKVSDAANEMRGPNAEEKFREKLGNDVDFEIYLELKASNMLEHYDDKSPPMPLSNGDETNNAILFGNGGGILNNGSSVSPSFSLLFDGTSQSQQQQNHNHQQRQQNGTMAQLLPIATAAGLPKSSFSNHVAFIGQLQNFLKARQQGEMTDSSENSNENQSISPGINSGQQSPLEPIIASPFSNNQLESRGGRKRAADSSNSGELFSLDNGIPNGQYKARKEDNELLENGVSDMTEEKNIEIVEMECSMNKKGQQQQQLAAASTSAASAIANGRNGMLDLWTQFNTLIQAQISAAKIQKEAADLQKVAAAELLQVGKSINELLPKLHAIMEKMMESSSKN